MLMKISTLREKDWGKWFDEDSQAMWREIKKMIRFFNSVLTDKEVEKFLARRQRLAINRNWKGYDYPKKFLGGKNHQFWKARTPAEKRIRTLLLKKRKSWAVEKGDPLDYTNNFWTLFTERSSSMTECLDRLDFKKLSIPIDVLAKVYGSVTVTDIMGSMLAGIWNHFNRTKQPRKAYDKLIPRIMAMKKSLIYREEVKEKFCIIFDRLVLECGYNPAILKG